MKKKITVDGVEFVARPNLADANRTVYEGGPMGGVVFVSRDGRFGHSRAWCDDFETAARNAISGAKSSYEGFKRLNDAYEAQAKNGGRVVK